MDDGSFHMFGLSHAVAMLVTVAAGVFMVRLNRSRTAAPRATRTANAVLAAVLLFSVFIDPLSLWLRYHQDTEEYLHYLCRDALPLHLCDAAALVLAWALIKRNQRGAELGYLWGLSGTLQGLLTPALKYDWDSLDYYGFFAQHGGVPVAAVALAFGAGLSPQPGALWRALRWSWAYMAVAGLCDWLLQVNYGYLSAPPEGASLIDRLGPWPWYLLSLQGVGIIFYSLLLLPFRRRWRKQKPAAPGNPLPASP